MDHGSGGTGDAWHGGQGESGEDEGDDRPAAEASAGRRIPFTPMHRLATALPASVVCLLLSAPVALAENDHGEGLYGETDDKVVTNGGFILMGFLVSFVFVASIIQWRLDRRKKQRWAAQKARAQRTRGGW